MGRHNSIVQVDSDTYALAYSDENEKGWIATFTISSNGSSITEISSLKHNNNQGLYNSLESCITLGYYYASAKRFQ